MAAQIYRRQVSLLIISLSKKDKEAKKYKKIVQSVLVLFLQQRAINSGRKTSFQNNCRRYVLKLRRSPIKKLAVRKIKVFHRNKSKRAYRQFTKN